MNNATIFRTIGADLNKDFGYALDRATIADVFSKHVYAHQSTARIQDFVPVLAERAAREELEELARERARHGTAKTRGTAKAQRVLFIADDNQTLAAAASVIANQLGAESGIQAVGVCHPEADVDQVLADAVRDRGFVDMPVTVASAGAAAHEHRAVRAADVVVYLTESNAEEGGLRAAHWNLDVTRPMTAERASEIVSELTARVQSMMGEMGVAKQKTAVAA